MKLRPIDIAIARERDPVYRELLIALAYHANTPPGTLIEMSCQRCPHLEIGSSPRSLAGKLWEHMRSKHPEAWKEIP